MGTLTAMLAILTGLDVFLVMIGAILSIVFGIVSRSEEDPMKKKKFGRAALWCGIGPAIALVLLLVLWGLIKIIASGH